MEKLLDRLGREVGAAFEKAGYDASMGKVLVSGRPDLCEYQCNGAMAGAKTYHKAPAVIAEAVKDCLAGTEVFSKAEVVKPGFLNLDVSEEFLAGYLNGMRTQEKLGYEPGSKRRMVIDYGGPNVAKPLHVGHLRSAVIGESLKRIARFHGDDVTGDIHLGDWGLQMGLVITEVKHRHPELPYFDPSFTGDYPAEAPFTVKDLEEIYPFASGKSKEDQDYYQEALENTHALQAGERGLRALWKHIMDVSTADMKRNYARLCVDFDLWNGESTVNDIIPRMVAKMKETGVAHESNGALVIDVARPDDAKELPPCMVLKSDGAALYQTTDLATIVDREEKIAPDYILYVTDKRQELHFEQVFRAARIAGLLPETTELAHIGFGTVNGKDGKPFKTRDGGVMRLETLIDDIDAAMLEKIRANEDIPEEEAVQTAKTVALAAIKYGDLSNQASKDYSFDMEKFTSFEGNTGPYILYTMVRIKSILSKYGKETENLEIRGAVSAPEKALMEELALFSQTMEDAYREWAPHRVCAYIYGLCNAFNSFYHATRILTEENEAQKESWIALLALTLKALEVSIGLLGFDAPERM